MGEEGRQIITSKKLRFLLIFNRSPKKSGSAIGRRWGSIRRLPRIHEAFRPIEAVPPPHRPAGRHRHWLKTDRKRDPGCRNSKRDIWFWPPNHWQTETLPPLGVKRCVPRQTHNDPLLIRLSHPAIPALPLPSRRKRTAFLPANPRYRPTGQAALRFLLSRNWKKCRRGSRFCR